jgi:hypothetical protein
VRLRVCSVKGSELLKYSVAPQPEELGRSELGAPSKVAVMVVGSGGKNPVTLMNVPVNVE